MTKTADILRWISEIKSSNEDSHILDSIDERTSGNVNAWAMFDMIADRLIALKELTR
jgi:hypothetical protein